MTLHNDQSCVSQQSTPLIKQTYSSQEPHFELIKNLVNAFNPCNGFEMRQKSFNFLEGITMIPMQRKTLW